MPKPITQRKEPKPSPAAGQRWGSDVIVDMLHHYELPYAALNPGASYRGLHDSMVNYGGNRPYMMLCQHEETAVQIAHGYAKASGKPMVAVLHNLVGLLHANLAVYYAYVDRVPVFIIGATGPMDETAGAGVHVLRRLAAGAAIGPRRAVAAARFDARSGAIYRRSGRARARGGHAGRGKAAGDPG
jgi:hypothetical protein